MELRNLQTFSKVCETMSFSRAAEELGYAQSTVTAQVAQLEEELGVPLFDRSGKRFRLNAKGEELLAYANRLTALADEARASVSDDRTPRGLLRLGTVDSLGTALLPAVLREYLLACPQVRVQVLTGSTREILEMLRQGRIDLMLTLDEKLHDPDLVCAWEREEDILFLCAPGHPFAGKEISLAQAVEENLLLTEQRCNYRGALERTCTTECLPLRSSLEVGNTSMILEYTKQNMGLSLLPRLIAQEALKEGSLATFSVREFQLTMSIQLVYRQSKWCSPAMETFVDNLKKEGEKSR